MPTEFPVRQIALARRARGVAARSAVAAAAALFLLGACGGAQSGSDFQVRGTNIVVNSTAPFTERADFQDRVESTIDAALRYWGGSWSDLQGKTVAFDGEQHVNCEGHASAIGCYSGSEIRVSTADESFTFYCVEETVLVHEVGHAIIGDADHTDPRWMDFGSVAQDLAGRGGYDASGDVPCNIFVNVWRHPPPSP